MHSETDAEIRASERERKVRAQANETLGNFLLSTETWKIAKEDASEAIISALETSAHGTWKVAFDILPRVVSWAGGRGLECRLSPAVKDTDRFCHVRFVAPSLSRPGIFDRRYR